MGHDRVLARVLAFRTINIFRTINMQEFRRVAAQQLGLCLQRELAAANERSHALLPQRKRVIRTKHYPAGSHCSHQKLQGTFLKDRRIHVEAIEISALSARADSMRPTMMIPGIFHSSQEKSEASSSWRHTRAQNTTQFIGRTRQH